MKNNIIQEFIGNINDVKIRDKNTYYSTLFVLEKIEEKFGEIYNKEFIIDLKETINTMYLKYENFSYSDLENEFYFSIKNSKEFKDIKFEYYGSDWKIENLNEGISNGIYVKEKENVIAKYQPKTKKELEEFYKDSKNFDYQKALKEDKIINSNAWNNLKSDIEDFER